MDRTVDDYYVRHCETHSMRMDDKAPLNVSRCQLSGP